MSKDKLQSLGGGSATPTTESKQRRNLTALVPVGLLLGFLVVFAAIFGPRLIPATEVETVPVVTIRAEAADSPEPAAESSGKGSMLFQASGWVEPDPYTTFVPTLVNGIVKEVHVLEGETVEKDQLLATLIDDDAKLALEQAERRLETMRARIAAHCSQVPALKAELDAARRNAAAEEARLAELKDEAGRLASLPPGTVPDLRVRQAALQVDRQQAVVEAIAAEIPRLEARLKTIDYERVAMGNQAHEINNEIATARLALERTTIRSPMDGVILHLHVAPGKKRMLNMDDPKSAVIVEIYDPESLQARIDVPLNEAARLSLGQSVEMVSDLLPNRTFEGVVTRIVGEADLQRNTLQVKVRIDNPDSRLRPGMLVRGKFFAAGSPDGAPPTSSSGRHRIFAPLEALSNVSGSSAVAWVAHDGRAERRELTLGDEERDGHREVLEGLRSGERVILPPHNKLKEGTRISEEPSGENQS